MNACVTVCKWMCGNCDETRRSVFRENDHFRTSAMLVVRHVIVVASFMRSGRRLGGTCVREMSVFPDVCMKSVYENECVCTCVLVFPREEKVTCVTFPLAFFSLLLIVK